MYPVVEEEEKEEEKIAEEGERAFKRFIPPHIASIVAKSLLIRIALIMDNQPYRLTSIVFNVSRKSFADSRHLDHG